MRISGPVPAGAPTTTLFDVAAPLTNASVTSWNAYLEQTSHAQADVGLLRDL